MNDELLFTFSDFVNVPLPEQKRIREQCSSGSECKKAVISHLISQHPALTWKLVANALYQTGSGDDESCHKALKHLKQLISPANERLT